eukprot:248487-Pleurochrysis_carterae.AAC.1
MSQLRAVTCDTSLWLSKHQRSLVPLGLIRTRGGDASDVGLQPFKGGVGEEVEAAEGLVVDLAAGDTLLDVLWCEDRRKIVKREWGVAVRSLAVGAFGQKARDEEALIAKVGRVGQVVGEL